MQYYIPPISFRARDHRVAKLVKHGTATDDELFEAQFKEWPVRGLQKDTPCPDIIHFKGFGADPSLSPLNFVTSMAYTRDDDPERNIYLNRLMLSPLGHVAGIFTSRQVYARAHDFVELLVEPRLGRLGIGFAMASVLLSSYRFAAMSSVVKMTAPSLSDVIGQEQIHGIDKLQNGPVRHATFQAVARDYINNSSSLRRTTTEVLQTIDMLLTWMPCDYYAADHELEARLHNVMAIGYPAWKKIPENISELYAALLDMGIKAPGAVEFAMLEKNQEANDLRKLFFRHSRMLTGLTNPPCAEMNIGLNSYRDGRVLKAYWQECLPMLYVNLLKKYGDSQAPIRFGYAGEDDILGLPTRSSLVAAPTLKIAPEA